MSIVSINPTTAVLAAIDRAPLGIFAYRDQRGRPTALPVTPYVYDGQVVVTTTLAFVQKAEHVRRDGRVALFAGGWHVRARARMEFDLSGDRFVEELLEQERRKYPPAERILATPFHRVLFDWYFGRVFMLLSPDDSTPRAGSDRCTLITLDSEGFPSATPLAEAPQDAGRIALPVAGGPPPDGPAAVLMHEANEPEMTELRQRILRGDVRDGVLQVRSQRETVTASRSTRPLAELRQLWRIHRQGKRGRRRVEQWITQDTHTNEASA